MDHYLIAVNNDPWAIFFIFLLSNSKSIPCFWGRKKSLHHSAATTMLNHRDVVFDDMWNCSFPTHMAFDKIPQNWNLFLSDKSTFLHTFVVRPTWFVHSRFLSRKASFVPLFHKGQISQPAAVMFTDLCNLSGVTIDLLVASLKKTKKTAHSEKSVK